MGDLAASLAALYPRRLEPGIYRGRLVKCEPRQGFRAPYWILHFDVKSPDDQWWSFKWALSLTPAAHPSWKMFEKAFRVTDWTDTADLIGQSCLLRIDLIPHPVRGDLVNDVAALLPLHENLPLDAVETKCHGCCPVHCA